MIQLSEMSDACEQTLYVLAFEDDLTPAEISHRLHDMHGVNTHWRTIEASLLRNRDLVSRRKRAHKWRYHILEAGRKRLDGASGPILFIDPSKSIQNVVTLHELFGGMNGLVRVCDPYLDESSIEHLDSLTGNVKYLTHNVKDSGRLRQTLAAFQKPGRTLEIKTTQKNVLHDRYIIDKTSMLILGTSLNGFGKKQCFLIRAGQDIRATMLHGFNEHWDSADVWQ
ncbi:MAG: hypothetical protein IIA05_08310 [Proteobacteria bacterium]|nr:hypothetical protein [Pseudomonadota bacterium]